jgi:hypothetical protein
MHVYYIQCKIKMTKVRILVNQQIDQPKVLISDDRHNNIHTSSSSNEITITNKNTPTHYISIGHNNVNIQ